MGILKTKLNFNQVISWGAASTLGVSFIKQMFDKDNEVSISELLERPIHPHFKCWILLREQFLTKNVLHNIAQDFAEEYISEQRKIGTYVDFRVDRLLDAKRKWINNEISTGILKENKKTAKEIEGIVSELNEANASKLAYVIYCLLETDATRCIKDVYLNTADFSAIVNEHRKGKYSDAWNNRLNYVKEKISSLDKDKKFLEEYSKKIPLKQKNTVSTKLENLEDVNTVPVGTIMAYAGENVSNLKNEGWFVCDGRVLNRTNYAPLFNAIESAFGAPDGTSFNIPDLRGVFLRGVSGDSNKDPDKNSRIELNPYGDKGNQVGSYQDYATGQPKKKFGATILKGNTSKTNYDQGCVDSVGGLNPQEISFPVSSGGGKESRPKNKYVCYIIKYKNTNSEGDNIDIPIGTVIPFSGINTKTINLNWRICDGQTYSNKGEFKRLFNAIKFAHGGVDNNQFLIPDYRGYFLRGVSEAEGKDPDIDSRGYPYPEGKDGFQGNNFGNVGSVQGDKTAASHNPFKTKVKVSPDKSGRLIAGLIRHVYKYNSASTTVEVAQYGGDMETRPENISINWYIRFR